MPEGQASLTQQIGIRMQFIKLFLLLKDLFSYFGDTKLLRRRNPPHPSPQNNLNLLYPDYYYITGVKGFIEAEIATLKSTIEGWDTLCTVP
ncbi:MAG: hypothetical protein KME60_10125 [Cyanomargarita calcarea GSE-NOS-MK-12-04C]|uniref:Uncharacterized protein n=1 Tax=Cyanomargarita calcarea GSE-NOS-MK-12-04C TaxID=2839659 RepID=A0A951QJU6_9CYAN|nr:hypothetical protein [Cyanomargarita calcarea GSE-NOS-MK-12-04C]